MTKIAIYKHLESSCMYQWQNQQAMPLVPGWILVLSDSWRCWEKLLCSLVWHYHQSYVQHYIANLMLVQWFIASHAKVWTSVLFGILSGVDSDHGTGPRRKGSVNSRATLCPIERGPCWPLTSSGWLRFVNWTISSWPRKPQTVLACSIYCVVKDRFSSKSESLKSATTFLPMSSASIRSLAMSDLAGTPKYKSTVHCPQN